MSVSFNWEMGEGGTFGTTAGMSFVNWTESENDNETSVSRMKGFLLQWIGNRTNNSFVLICTLMLLP